MSFCFAKQDTTPMQQRYPRGPTPGIVPLQGTWQVFAANLKVRVLEDGFTVAPCTLDAHNCETADANLWLQGHVGARLEFAADPTLVATIRSKTHRLAQALVRGPFFAPTFDTTAPFNIRDALGTLARLQGPVAAPSWASGSSDNYWEFGKRPGVCFTGPVDALVTPEVPSLENPAPVLRSLPPLLAHILPTPLVVATLSSKQYSSTCVGNMLQALTAVLSPRQARRLKTVLSSSTEWGRTVHGMPEPLSSARDIVEVVTGFLMHHHDMETGVVALRVQTTPAARAVTDALTTAVDLLPYLPGLSAPVLGDLAKPVVAAASVNDLIEVPEYLVDAVVYRKPDTLNGSDGEWTESPSGVRMLLGDDAAFVTAVDCVSLIDPDGPWLRAQGTPDNYSLPVPGVFGVSATMYCTSSVDAFAHELLQGAVVGAFQRAEIWASGNFRKLQFETLQPWLPFNFVYVNRSGAVEHHMLRGPVRGRATYTNPRAGQAYNWKCGNVQKLLQGPVGSATFLASDSDNFHVVDPVTSLVVRTTLQGGERAPEFAPGATVKCIWITRGSLYLIHFVLDGRVPHADLNIIEDSSFSVTCMSKSFKVWFDVDDDVNLNDGANVLVEHPLLSVSVHLNSFTLLVDNHVKIVSSSPEWPSLTKSLLTAKRTGDRTWRLSAGAGAGAGDSGNMPVEARAVLFKCLRKAEEFAAVALGAVPKARSLFNRVGFGPYPVDLKTGTAITRRGFLVHVAAESSSASAGSGNLVRFRENGSFNALTPDGTKLWFSGSEPVSWADADVEGQLQAPTPEGWTAKSPSGRLHWLQGVDVDGALVYVAKRWVTMQEFDDDTDNDDSSKTRSPFRVALAGTVAHPFASSTARWTLRHGSLAAVMSPAIEWTGRFTTPLLHTRDRPTVKVSGVALWAFGVLNDTGGLRLWPHAPNARMRVTAPDGSTRTAWAWLDLASDNKTLWFREPEEAPSAMADGDGGVPVPVPVMPPWRNIVYSDGSSATLQGPLGQLSLQTQTLFMNLAPCGFLEDMDDNYTDPHGRRALRFGTVDTDMVPGSRKVRAVTQVSRRRARGGDTAPPPAMPFLRAPSARAFRDLLPGVTTLAIAQKGGTCLVSASLNAVLCNSVLTAYLRRVQQWTAEGRLALDDIPKDTEPVSTLVHFVFKQARVAALGSPSPVVADWLSDVSKHVHRSMRRRMRAASELAHLPLDMSADADHRKGEELAIIWTLTGALAGSTLAMVPDQLWHSVDWKHAQQLVEAQPWPFVFRAYKGPTVPHVIERGDESTAGAKEFQLVGACLTVVTVGSGHCMTGVIDATHGPCIVDSNKVVYMHDWTTALDAVARALPPAVYGSFCTAADTKCTVRCLAVYLQTSLVQDLQRAPLVHAGVKVALDADRTAVVAAKDRGPGRGRDRDRKEEEDTLTPGVIHPPGTVEPVEPLQLVPLLDAFNLVTPTGQWRCGGSPDHGLLAAGWGPAPTAAVTFPDGRVLYKWLRGSILADPVYDCKGAWNWQLAPDENASPRWFKALQGPDKAPVFGPAPPGRLLQGNAMAVSADGRQRWTLVLQGPETGPSLQDVPVNAQCILNASAPPPKHQQHCDHALQALPDEDLEALLAAYSDLVHTRALVVQFRLVPQETIVCIESHALGLRMHVHDDHAGACAIQCWVADRTCRAVCSSVQSLIRDALPAMSPLEVEPDPDKHLLCKAKPGLLLEVDGAAAQVLGTCLQFALGETFGEGWLPGDLVVRSLMRP